MLLDWKLDRGVPDAARRHTLIPEVGIRELRCEPFFLSVKKPESLGVNPTFIGESVAPPGSCYIASFVPMRFFGPVEEFSQARVHIFRGTTLQ
jgi:hypothetical protein